MGKIIIIGHKNPDTDSIVSAFGAKAYLQVALGMEAEVFRAGEINNETKFVLERFGVAVPPLVGDAQKDDRVVLVDHNEKTQVFSGLDFSRVDHIFDHHKIALETDRPIFCHMEPIGSTSSLMAKLILGSGHEIDEATAKLLLAGILSDTLNLTSPTATREDKKIVTSLNEIAKLDIKEFVDEMFAAKSSLDGISVSDIITLDYKTFEMGPAKVGVGTWETTGPESVNEKKEEILAALKEKKQASSLDYIFFMVVDIIRQDCKLYLIDEAEKELAQKVFGGRINDGTMELPGVVSRKKQIIPPLTEALTK